MPVGLDKSDPLKDSPQHVIKAANHRNTDATGRDLSGSSARTAKSDEDAQLMYVVIKPAVAAKPPVKKYKSDNKAVYMSGVVKGKGNTDGRTPRLNMAGGAYPVFYSIASANGKFGRSIRAMSKDEISQAEAKLLH